MTEKPKPQTVSVTTTKAEAHHVLNPAPRYLVIVHGAMLVSVALASTKAGAREAIAPYEDDPEVETSIRSLPLSSSDQLNASSLLEAIGALIVDVTISESVAVSMTMDFSGAANRRVVSE